MSPRIARAEEPVAGGSPMRSVTIRAEINRVMQQQRARDADSITLARRFAGAQQERDRLIAEDAPAAEVSAARELVERLRREQDELVGVRAHLAAKSKQLRQKLVPIEAQELTDVAVKLAADLDTVLRGAAREARSLLPQVEKAVAAQRIAERQLSAAQGRGADLHLIADAGVALDAMVATANVLARYATECRAPRIARNDPVEAGSADASPTTSAASVEV